MLLFDTDGRRKERGFTLLEMSIVLLIVAFLAGGIVGGQSLIRAAKLNKAIEQRSTYVNAVKLFKDKYLALPGDMTNATSFWGSVADCSTDVSGTKTCNGNGDGIVDVLALTTQTLSDPAGKNREDLRAWQHLGNAGLVAGRYVGCGSCAASVPDYSLGSLSPEAPLNSAHYDFLFGGRDVGGSIDWRATATLATFDAARGSVLRLSAVNANSGALTPDDAASLDTKADDGKPGLGSVTSQISTATGGSLCVSSSNPATAIYNVQNSALACQLYYTTGF